MLKTQTISRIEGQITVPGDKSISHRAVMLLSISKGKGRIRGFLPALDCQNTIGCFRQLGVEIEHAGQGVVISGRGLRGLRAPEKVLDAGNSGTTMRLICGILAAQGFSCTITGDASLQRRPMDRIIGPLRQMGAALCGVDGTDRPPLTIEGRKLRGIDYTLPIPSAQVKSSILLAGLYAEGETLVREVFPARDHTEIMLASLGARIQVDDGTIRLACSELQAQEIRVPGDISSAAFFLCAAAAMPGSHLVIRNVGLNPTRTGIIDVLGKMGAAIAVENQKNWAGEKVGDLVVRGRMLHGTTITKELVPVLVDEIPILAVIAAMAEGTTTITGAEELRVKESNRIAALVAELGKLGVRIEELPDGLVIQGPSRIRGGVELASYGDHRMAMALAVAGLFAPSSVRIQDSACIDISFPGFKRVLQKVVK